MIVYSDSEQKVSTQWLIQRIESASDPLERLILAGQLEAGVVDAVCSEYDDETPVTRELRRGIFRGLPLPETITIKTPEGFAFYGLYPDQYEDAARRFHKECLPETCVVIGIRSIGTTLSSVVARTLEECGTRVWSLTVRPRGHPFDRHVALAPDLENRILEHAGEFFCIVDEGPGLSGSSFISVADKLGSLGVPDARILIFASHDPNPAGFVSDRAKTQWSRFKKYVEPFRPERYVRAGAPDISAGEWRNITGIWPAVHPQHERRKYLVDETLWKFAGLAHLGRARFERGRLLSSAGFIPRVLKFENGFIVSDFATQRDPSGPQLLDVMARYLAFLRREFATNLPVPYKEIAEMVAVNIGQQLPSSDALVEDGTVIQIDGRMLPQEWIGSIKTDALDHYDDHFFPGCQDIAWDIAGAAIEFGFDARLLAEKYLQLMPDPTLKRRLPFYRTAYLAYRIGYADMAAESLRETADGRRFRNLRNRYTLALTNSAA